MNIIQGYYRCVDDISLNEGEESISDVGVGYEDGDSLDNFSDECEWQSILSFSPSESLFTAGDDVEVYNCDRLEEEWELLSLNDESETVTSSAERWLTGKYDSIVSVDEWERVSASDESLSARGKEVSEADSNVDRCVSILEAVVNGVSRKFTNRSICECRYKKELLSLPDVKEDTGIDDVSTQEEAIDIVFRVAVNVVVEVNDDCDFLLKSSDRVKSYFVASLGISGSEVTRILLNRELDVFNSSDEELSSMVSYLAVRLLRDVAANCFYFRDSRHYADLQTRSSLDIWCATIFLRKLIVLLIFFPEALHPRFVSYGLDKQFFDDFFTSEGRCRVKYRVKSDVA